MQRIAQMTGFICVLLLLPRFAVGATEATIVEALLSAVDAAGAHGHYQACTTFTIHVLETMFETEIHGHLYQMMQVYADPNDVWTFPRGVAQLVLEQRGQAVTPFWIESNITLEPGLYAVQGWAADHGHAFLLRVAENGELLRTHASMSGGIRAEEPLRDLNQLIGLYEVGIYAVEIPTQN